MKAEVAQIERNLAAMRGLIASIRDPTIPDVPTAIVVFSAAPFLQQSHSMILAWLESLLERKFQGNLGLQFAATLTERPPNYWTRDPISEGVIDTAEELGIIDAGEKEILLKAAQNEALLKEYSGKAPRDSEFAVNGNLSPGTQIRISITARNAAGESQATAPVQAVVP